MTRPQAWVVGLLVVALAAFAVYRIVVTEPEPQGAPRPTEEMLGRWPRSQFYMERDRFLPATDPRTIPAGEAGFLQPSDEVFGVVVKGEARAYPVPMISYHHVVNDVIQGIPVAITY